MAGRDQQYIVVVNSAQDKAYQILRKRILNLELAPGTLISTQKIADELAVSRTPVREAFLKLQEENLLEMSHQKPSMVSKIDLKRVHQECFIRRTLEMGNMRLFAANPPGEMIRRMRRNIDEQREALESQDYELFQNLDNKLHAIPFQHTGQKLAVDIIFKNNGHYDRSRLLIRSTKEVTNDIIGEHEELLGCIVKGDVANAVQFLENHIEAIQPLQNQLLQLWPEYFV